MRLTPRYSVCLDVGSEQDHSVFTVLRYIDARIKNPAGEDIDLPHYGLVYLEQMPLKTQYPEIIARAAYILDSMRHNAHFLVDATGVGNPVVQMMQHLNPIPIVIVSGHTVNQRETGGYNVPKREIVTSLQAVMHGRRLQIAKGLDHIEQLKKEILGFKMKVRDSGSIGWEAASERTHDDIVMSLGVNVWYNEKMYGYRMSSNLFESSEEPYDPFEAYG